MTNVILIGNGGHSKVIQQMIKRNSSLEFAGVLDNAINEKSINDGIIYDNLNNIQEYYLDYKFVIAIGNNLIRKKIIKDYRLSDEYFVSVIDPSAIIADDANIGVGTVIMPGVIINPGTKIGNHSIINSGAIIEHDNNIEDFVHISPNATLTGTVRVKSGSHIGAAATIIPNVTVGEWCVVGAGSVVIRDVNDYQKIAGVPAKEI